MVKPEKPLYIPSGERVTLYSSTPLWIVLRAGERKLLELPSHRPSDSWFGPNTLSGELCYATRSSGRLTLAELPVRPHRAVTPITIANQASDSLLLERLKAPLPYLALYRGSGGLLWTQAMTLVREADGDLADLQLGRGAPKEAKRPERLADARQRPEGPLSLRAFSRLFRGD